MPEPGRRAFAQLRVYPDTASLTEAAALLVVEAAKSCAARQGTFSFLLSGGSTPLGVYRRLAQTDLRRAVDWQQVHFFWGDERCVPPQHPDSNYGAAWENLILHLPSPGRNLHRVPGELGAVQAAEQYEREILAYFRNQPGSGAAEGLQPHFDLVFLGVGEDGHTASLFPGSPALEQQRRWVTPVEHSTPPPPLVDRVSVTLPLLNLARQVVILAAGTGKASILQTALEQPGAGLPIQRVLPQDGELIWMADESAAALLAGAGR